MDRKEEIRDLNRLSVDELVERAEGHLILVDDLDQLYCHFSASILSVIRSNNEIGRNTALILPYGPTGQYPLVRDTVNRERISLASTRIFFMDEYADNSGRALPPSHPLSFKGQIEWLWEEINPELRPGLSNVVFPYEGNADRLEDMIEAAGGIDVCYGGVGIHGHLAFNEPAAGVRESGPRLARLNDYTVTMNAIRSQVGGDLENFPRAAWTLGMKQCLAARRICLYCRNDVPNLDWANTVLRLALLGEPGDDYPVTWIRSHKDWQIVADQNTARPPSYVLPILD